MKKDNKNYKQPKLSNDPVMEDVTQKILPFVRQVEMVWGKFKSDIIKKQSAGLPKAYFTRFGFSKIENISGHGQEVLTNYAIAVVINDNAQDGDLQMMAIENGIVQSLQDLSYQGKNIQNIKSSDLTTTNTNNIRILSIAFQIPFVFLPQDSSPIDKIMNRSASK